MAKLKNFLKVLTGDQAIHDYKEVSLYVGVILSVHIWSLSDYSAVVCKVNKKIRYKGDLSANLFC